MPIRDMEMFAGLRGHDLAQYRFAVPALRLVAVEGCEAAGAVYHRPGEALALVGNLARLEKRILWVELDALALALLYFAGMWFLYSRGAG